METNRNTINESFIRQTAKDYDMCYDVVLDIYKYSDNLTEFYNRLEDLIRIRRNKM